jgi:hypothetical protein
MLKYFRKIPVYIKIYPDKVEISNIHTGETISKTALIKFSSNRMLVADFNIAEDLIRTGLKELRLSKYSLKILIQQMKSFEGGIFESERRILRDLGDMAGGFSVTIVEHTRVLSNDEALYFLQVD